MSRTGRGVDHWDMTTLHIEHAVTDFAEWKSAFDRFAQMREEAGVHRQRVYQPADNPQYVVLHLDFHEASQAEKYLSFLQDNVWAQPGNVPTLVGQPQARILTPAQD